VVVGEAIRMMMTMRDGRSDKNDDEEMMGLVVGEEW